MAVTPPPELVGYGNGRIPTSALRNIGGNFFLWGPAGDAYNRMLAAASAAGINIGVTDAYRPYDQQVDVARRKGLYSQGGLAAKPGTSPHGWGVALDLNLNNAALNWLRSNGTNFGFFGDTPREPWHWEYRGGGGGSGGLGLPPGLPPGLDLTKFQRPQIQPRLNVPGLKFGDQETEEERRKRLLRARGIIT